MTKPIEFETFTHVTDTTFNNSSNKQAVKVEKGAFTNAIELNVETAVGHYVFATYSDPAKLDALAGAIKRAAEALRTSQRLTFGDLGTGEWFGLTSDNRVKDAVYRKGSGTMFTADEPVARVKVTFTEDKGTT